MQRKYNRETEDFIELRVFPLTFSCSSVNLTANKQSKHDLKGHPTLPTQCTCNPKDNPLKLKKNLCSVVKKRKRKALGLNCHPPAAIINMEVGTARNP